jgi:hypothetical protein
VHRDDVAKSPAVLDKLHITPDEEARLYRYYGIPYTAERSLSLLPVGEGPLPSRLTIARRAVAGAAATARRRFADPPTITLTAFNVVLAVLLWAALRRQRNEKRTPAS